MSDAGQQTVAVKNTLGDTLHGIMSHESQTMREFSNLLATLTRVEENIKARGGYV